MCMRPFAPDRLCYVYFVSKCCWVNMLQVIVPRSPQKVQTMTADLTGDDIIRILALEPLIEGGHFREIYRDAPADGSRGVMTSIYFLLRAGERSTWNRIDAPQIWCYHSGSPLEVSTWIDGRSVEKHRLGSDLLGGERPQLSVPAGAWQAAETLGDWSLVGCIVAPAFQFSGYEVAPDGWSPTPQHSTYKDQ